MPVIGADLPNAIKLAQEILNDLDRVTLGIRWWNSLPVQERILIGDYLYQCANGIELNLAEAKLHYFEWLDARDQKNKRIADAVSFDSRLRPRFNHPPSLAPTDDLPDRLERLHLCGFFRAIGSSLDCLGATIIGVLGLRTSLRYGDLKSAQRALKALVDPAQAGAKLQIGFREFFTDIKSAVGPEDWLDWADQYRNMFVHRGRRALYRQVIPRENLFFDARGQIIPRVTSKLNLARYPDRSEIEALVKTKEVLLSDDTNDTLSGIFESCKAMEEKVCERLQLIWNERKNNPTLIEQPLEQWKAKLRSNNFPGYRPSNQSSDQLTITESLKHRMLAASVDDAHRSLWDNSDWAE